MCRSAHKKITEINDRSIEGHHACCWLSPQPFVSLPMPTCGTSCKQLGNLPYFYGALMDLLSIISCEYLVSDCLYSVQAKFRLCPWVIHSYILKQYRHVQKCYHMCIFAYGRYFFSLRKGCGTASGVQIENPLINVQRHYNKYIHFTRNSEYQSRQSSINLSATVLIQNS